MRRSRYALGVLAALCSLAAVLPAGAQARTHHVSIIAVPNPIDAGDPVAIVGHVSGPGNANRRVNLFHRLPSQLRIERLDRKTLSLDQQHIVRGGRLWLLLQAAQHSQG